MLKQIFSVNCDLLQCSVFKLAFLPEGWSARMQLPEESMSVGSNVLWIMMRHNTSGHTSTGQLLRLWQRFLSVPLPFTSSCVYRVGRTARAGKSGLAFTFLLGVQVIYTCMNDWSHNGKKLALLNCVFIFRRKSSSRWWWMLEVLAFRSR